MGEARYRLHVKKSGKLLKLMSLPPNEKNVCLGKAANYFLCILGTRRLRVNDGQPSQH